MDAELQEAIRTFAHRCLSGGQSVIPIGQDKKPAVAWAQYYETAMQVEQWDYPDCNIGIVTGMISQVVVVDCDNNESVLGWLKTKPLTPLRVKSKRGMHFYYRHPGGYVKSDSYIKDKAGFEYDVKGDRSYAMIPPSFRSGHQYQVIACRGNVLAEWLSPERLPLFQVEWRPERVKPVWDEDDAKIKDGLAYIMTIQAIEGSGGDKATYRAACKLKESGMSESQALAALVEWNVTNAKPAWSARELLRKVQCAFSEHSTNGVLM